MLYNSKKSENKLNAQQEESYVNSATLILALH